MSSVERSAFRASFTWRIGAIAMLPGRVLRKLSGGERRRAGRGA